MRKLLLTTVFKPFGIDDEYGNASTLAEFHHTNLTSAQGVFSIRGANPNLGLHFIAENLEIPTVVLENPSLSEFKQELSKGYDYVGVNFAPTTFDKARKMCEVVKEVSPKSKTIVGGYGSAVPEAEKIADYVCRGEGVQFMRQLLGEPQDRPLKHPRVANKGGEVMGISLGRAGLVAAGLGCRRGCEFCLTSHHYNCKYLPLLRTGKEIYDVMQDQAKELPLKERTLTRDFLIIDEDFLGDKKRVDELASYTSKEVKEPMLFACFGAAASIMQYDFADLAAMGLECVWLGVESPNQFYAKLKGIDLKRMISSLHDHGIMTITSMVLGYDFHTEENIWKDIDYLLSLESTFNQFMLYTPLPGTPLFKKMSQEGRIFNLPWKDFDGFHFTTRHPNITPKRMEEIQKEAYKKDFHVLGPSIIRGLNANWQGYHKFKNSTVPILQKRASEHLNSCTYGLALFPAAANCAPNKETRQQILDFQADMIGEFGLSSKVKWASRYISARMSFVTLMNKFFPSDVIQPKLVSRSFRLSPHELISMELVGKKLEGVKENILHISVQEVEKIQAKLVVCKGYLDELTAEKIYQRLNAFLERTSKSLILDFGEISHIEPAALQILLNKLAKYRQRVKIIFQKQQFEKINHSLEGKLASFEIFNCWEEAVKSFA